MLNLTVVKRTYPQLLENMKNHYSKPKGFVGRNICYAVTYDEKYYGSIVGGSATLHLPGRKDWLESKNISATLEEIVNNIFFHIEGPYPARNFSSKVLNIFHEKIQEDWYSRYRDDVKCFETLVELPRTGEVYTRVGYTKVGTTKGQTCKRVSGISTEKWSGVRVWDKVNLRPKDVYMKDVTND